MKTTIKEEEGRKSCSTGEEPMVTARKEQARPNYTYKTCVIEDGISQDPQDAVRVKVTKIRRDGVDIGQYFAVVENSAGDILTTSYGTTGSNRPIDLAQQVLEQHRKDHG